MTEDGISEMPCGLFTPRQNKTAQRLGIMQHKLLEHGDDDGDADDGDADDGDDDGGWYS